MSAVDILVAFVCLATFWLGAAVMLFDLDRHMERLFLDEIWDDEDETIEAPELRVVA